MEIRPNKADIRQIARGRDGKMVTIEDDVQNVANRLAEIDEHLCLRYSEAGQYFVVYWKPDGAEDGDGELVTTAQELDQRIVQEVERIYWKTRQPGYSFADELEAVEAQAKKEREEREKEMRAEDYLKLGHAMRKDLGKQNRIFLPAGVKTDDA